MRVFLLLLLLLCFSPTAFSQVSVVFIEMYGADGKLVRLTPDGRFAHSAISYQEKWLHAYPGRGVEVVTTEELSRFGRLAEVILVKDQAPLNEFDVAYYLGKPFDSGYLWDDDRIYCSELLGKLLNLEPEPMHFDKELWPGANYQKLNGLPGLSPDAIYERLTRPAN